MSQDHTTDDTSDDTGESKPVNVRFPDRLLERVDDRVDAEDEHETRSDLIREAARVYCLEGETRERLDVDETSVQASFPVDGGEGA